MQRDKLIYMAKQIATFCESSPRGARETANVADHINKFWEPRMRRKLFEKIEGGETEGVHPLVLEAMADIRRPPPPEKLPES